jgi:antirestriction protein ArdC
MQKAKTTNRPNVCQIVTDRIIESLQNGIIPWEKHLESNHVLRRYLSPQLPYRQALQGRKCHAALEHGL